MGLLYRDNYFLASSLRQTQPPGRSTFSFGSFQPNTQIHKYKYKYKKDTNPILTPGRSAFASDPRWFQPRWTPAVILNSHVEAQKLICSSLSLSNIQHQSGSLSVDETLFVQILVGGKNCLRRFKFYRPGQTCVQIQCGRNDRHEEVLEQIVSPGDPGR